MKITYLGSDYNAIKGKTFEVPDDDTVSFGTFLRDGDKSYSVLWCDCSVIYEDNNLNIKHGIIVEPNATVRRVPENEL